MNTFYDRIRPWACSTRGQVALLAVLTAVVWLSRVLFASKILYHWDSVNFAYAMGEFNLAKEQPQPPGYIVYVWLCQLLNLALHDAQTVMVVISIASSLGAVIAMFGLGAVMYNRRVAWAGAIFLAASPLFWFYNEIALPHTLDAFLVIGIAYTLFRVDRGERRFILPAVILLALAGGVRQQTLVFLGPLMLFSFRKIGWKNFVLAGLVGLAVCLAWFIPLMALSGGVGQYMQVMNAFSARFQDSTSVFLGGGWRGLARNLTKLVLYTGYGWSLFAIPVLVVAFRSIQKLRAIRINEKLIFLGMWVFPALVYYLFVHMGQQGLVFVYLPALILAGAAALEYLLSARPASFWICAFTLAAISAGIFLFLPEYPLGEGSQRFLTANTIVDSDRYYMERFDFLRKNYPADRTFIVSTNWHHVQWYLPEYKTFTFTIGAKWEVDEGAPLNPTSSLVRGTAKELGIDRSAPVKIVLFDPELGGYSPPSAEIEWITLADQSRVGVLTISATDVFYVQSDQFGVIKH